MKGALTIIKTDGTVISEMMLMTPAYLTIKAELDGGSLELVPLFDQYNGERCVVFCNEEGRNYGLPRNLAATTLWHAHIRAQGRDPMRVLTPPDAIDGLVGPIVIVSGDDELLASL